MRAVTQRSDSLTTALHQHIAQAIAAEGGWLVLTAFMVLILYTPGFRAITPTTPPNSAPCPNRQRLCDCASNSRPCSARRLPVGEALERTTHEVWEFGAGSGAGAAVADALGDQRSATPSSICRQPARAPAGCWWVTHKLRWVDAPPEKFSGCGGGHEAGMPCRAIAGRHGGQQAVCGMSAARWY